MQFTCKCLNLLGHLVHLTSNFCIEISVHGSKLKIFENLFIYFHFCVDVCIWVLVGAEARVGLTGTIVTGSCELPNVDARN